MLLLAALALAEPVWLVHVPKRGDIVLVMDASASMQTRTARGTRFERARQKALDLIDQCHAAQRMLIIEAARTPRLVSSWSQSTAAARDLIRDLQAWDVPGSLDAALALALSCVDPAGDDSVYLITDGAGGGISELLERHPTVIPLVVTGGGDNVGITRFDMRPQPDAGRSYELMLEIKSFMSRPTTFAVRLTMDHSTLYDAPVTLAALEKKRLIVPYDGPVSGIVRAELDIDDDLRVDNRAALAPAGSGDLWVLLLSKGNYFLEKLLKAHPRVMVKRHDRDRALFVPAAGPTARHRDRRRYGFSLGGAGQFFADRRLFTRPAF